MGAPASRMVCCNNNHYPRCREHFLTPSVHCHTHPFGGLGLKGSYEGPGTEHGADRGEHSEQTHQCHAPPLHVSPQKWAVGHTFECEFDLPVPCNPAYDGSSKTTRKVSRPVNSLIGSIPVGTVQAAASRRLLTGKASEPSSSRHHGAWPG